MSMYAVVAPGLSCVYTNWQDVERVKALYPYPKWAKVYDEQAAYEWLRRNTYGHGLYSVSHYGDILPNLYVKARYKIFTDCVCISYDVSEVGDVRLKRGNYLVEYKDGFINVKIPDFVVSEESLAGHMSVIYNLLDLIGSYLDVDIELPYYSLYYCLTAYKGNKQRPVSLVRSLIHERAGNVSYSLMFHN